MRDHTKRMAIQTGDEFVTSIHSATAGLPKHVQIGLTDQMRRVIRFVERSLSALRRR